MDTNVPGVESTHVTVLIFIIFMTISEYPLRDYCFFITCRSQLVHGVHVCHHYSCMFKGGWPHCPHSEYGSAIWRPCMSCRTWDETWQSYTDKPAYPCTADTTLLTLDRTGQEYRYTHVKSTLERVSNPVFCCINGIFHKIRHNFVEYH